VTAANAEYFSRVLSQLKKFGLLLESDPRLPSVATIITGSPLHSSWWSHPLAHTIFHVNGQLDDHPDVLVTKLIAGKVTWVHRKLWPEILAIGAARERWQTEALSPSAQALLEMVDATGSLRTDNFTDKLGRPGSTTGSMPIPTSRSKKLKPGDAARELERKLLVHAAQVHTESGAHAKFLETWEHWTKRMGFRGAAISVNEAKQKMEARLGKLNTESKATAQLPWIKFESK
jgi:hypothetical protein